MVWHSILEEAEAEVKANVEKDSMVKSITEEFERYKRGEPVTKRKVK